MKKRRKTNSRFHKFICFALNRIVRTIFRVRVIGEENEPTEGGFLMCANHLSAADPFIITAAASTQICFMSKKELFKIPVIGAAMRGLGAFPVDRRAGDVGAVKHAIKLLKEDKSVGLFPQGTRCPDRDPRETAVRNGAAMIAYHANATVLPIFLHRKGNSGKAFRRTTVIIGKPIPFSEFGYDAEKKGEYNRIAGEIFDRICRLGEELESCEK